MQPFLKFLIFTLCLLPIALAKTVAQSSNPWVSIQESDFVTQEQTRKIVPQKYQTFSLSVAQMKSMLAQAPLWQTPAAEQGGVEITLPMPDGSFQRFMVVEAPVMHPDLQKKYPEIRTYAGVGIDDPAAYFRGDFTLRGFHGMIRSPEHSTVYLDPYAFGDIEHYQVYYKKDFSKSDAWECRFDEVNSEPSAQTAQLFAESVLAGDCQRRVYALALSCTGEYAAFHGGTTALVLSAYNTTMARVNGVFEQEASVTMTLVPNTNLLIYLDAATDPFTNGNGNTMLTENQNTCNAVIGNANYDIGHVFSTGGGGVAVLGAVCNTSSKAQGVTGQGSPIGDPFDIDYVAHEMGHQFGANHTQNNACQRSGAVAMEPGSASTIMGYAGICSPNVQNNSDDYFHAASLQQIATEVTSNGTNGGNTCSTNTTINNAPTANAGLDYTIPRSTPFILTGSGTDPNGHALTYTWEQMDNAVATMPPVATNTGGPTFRTFKGTSNPARYLPRLTDVVNNVNPTWEVLPSVARTLNFRLTTRDNFAGGGCTAEDNMVVTVNGTAGPFLVTAPNTAVTYGGNSTQTVTWDVASTNLAPINCANVDILMSTDGGLTYPYTLATATPNDGSQAVTIPIVTTTTARIMVRANGNIFYDISNANFTVSGVAFGFSIASTPPSQVVCQPTNAIYTVNLTPQGGFSGNVNLSVAGLPPGATANFSPATVTTAGTSTLTINNAGSTPGAYSPTITGTSGTTTATNSVSLTINPSSLGQVTLAAPANNTTNISVPSTLSWSNLAGASTYQVQVSTTSGFTTNIVDVSGIATASYTITAPLGLNTTYFWRTRGTNTCATGAWSSVFQFTTGCTQTLNSTNTPVAISSTGTPTVTSTLAISGVTGNITGFKVSNLAINHTWVGDVKATLTSPANVVYTLFDRPGNPVSADGCSQNHILTTFDDAATLTSANFESACSASTAAAPPPYAISGTYKPITSFANLIGTSPNGVWTLTVQDLVAGDGGSIQSWGIEITTACITPSNAVLALSQTFIQGYMNGSTMRPVMANAVAAGGTVPGVPAPTATQCDLITVELHNTASPYALAHTQRVILNTNGTTTANFPVSAIGNSYYVVIKGRNIVETWSAAPVAFTTSTIHSFAAAFGGNLGLAGTIPVIFSGDFAPPQDGFVDAIDYAIWEANYNNFSQGYFAADLNGDGFVDAIDYAIWETNYNSFIGVVKP
jgi:subtilisin-like proprotein convertase family protein